MKIDRKNIRIVLVETTHAGNIGAAARAMKTMGLSDLALVSPCAYKTYECYARASGAGEIIDAVTSHATLQDAVGDVGLVIGTSARLRSLAWPQLPTVEAAQKIAAASLLGKVAIVFGRERSGLTNDELALCSSLLIIPSNEQFSSLNLAAAVQIVSYELMRAELPDSPLAVAAESPAEQAELERFYEHLAVVMEEIGYYDPANPRLLMTRMRRLFNRAEPSVSELQVLRGVLAQMQKGRRVD
ncbi:hypothetical protein AB833_25155 [Chromatiales bacterium (ex Bugula neritina AB1)]|nr:hypothetical protein AB833_25155 [Chromatiales bacterium (ex Bugula neritina AB1)]